MDLGKRFRTDKELETGGTWIKIDGSEFLIARVQNPAYKSLSMKLFDEHASALDGVGQEVFDLDNKLMAEVYSHTILLGWKNVKVDGKPVKYSQKKAAELLEELDDFFDLIKAYAENIDNFKVKTEQAQVKNS